MCTTVLALPSGDSAWGLHVQVGPWMAAVSQAVLCGQYCVWFNH